MTLNIKQYKLAVVLLLAINGHLEVLPKLLELSRSVSYSIITAIVDRKHSLHVLGNLITGTSPIVFLHGARVRERGREGETQRWGGGGNKCQDPSETDPHSEVDVNNIHFDLLHQEQLFQC